MQALIFLSACVLVSSTERSCNSWPCKAVKRRVALKGKQYPCFKRGILECVEETKVSTQLVLQVTSGNWNVRDDYRLKEWARCLLVRSNMMSKHGVFQLDVAMAGVADHDKSAVETLIDQCLYTSPHKPEDVAWHFLKCYHERQSSKLLWCCEYQEKLYTDFVALKGRHYSCFKRNILECVEKSKVNTQLVLQITSGDWDIDDDYRLKQWARCLLVRSNMMSKGGVFQLDVALALVPKRDKAAVETLIDQCLFTTPQAPEDTAWYFLKCYHINNPKYRYL